MQHRALSKPYQLVMMEKKPPQIADGKPQPQAAYLQDREEGRKNVVQPKKIPPLFKKKKNPIRSVGYCYCP